MRRYVPLLISALLTVSAAQADIMTPKGEIAPYHGTVEFKPAQMRSQVTKDALVFTIYTKYPLTKVDYNKSDLRLQISEKEDYVVKLTGPNKGKVFRNPEWQTSEMFVGIGEFCRHPNGKFIIVQAHGGTYVGTAGVFEEYVGAGEYSLRVIIPLKIIGGKTGMAQWATALCGNSVVSDLFTAPELPSCCPQPTYKIDPSFTNNNPVVPYWTGPSYYPFWGYPGFYGGWIDPIYPINPIPPTPPVPVPSGVILFGSGLVMMVWRQWKH